MDLYQNVLQQARLNIQDGLELTETFIQDIANNAPGSLKDRMLTITARPGKRVRSTLLFLIAQTGQGQPALERIAKAAASIEMLHLASLLHDDVIDSTDLRRGEPTAHSLWGNQLAILVGDFTLSKALELVVSDIDNRIPIKVSQASSQLVAGEILEIDLTGTQLTQAEYFEVIDGKTAALIEAAAACGAILAQHSPEQIIALTQMGRQFGIAFQIIDDLLDFGFGASDLGKAKFSDLSNDVMTLPMIIYMEESSAEKQEEMRLLRNTAIENSESRTQITKILSDSGAFLKTQKIALDLVQSALQTINSLPQSKGKEHLLAMCGSMAVRSN